MVTRKLASGLGSFAVAPILAILNDKAVTAKGFINKPKKWLIIYAWIGIIFLSLFSVFYIIWKYL